MSILAVDMSLTGTGYAYRTDTGVLVVRSIVQKEARGMQRLHTILTTLQRQPVEDMKLLVVEGYAFGFGKGKSRQHSIGELGGVVKYDYWSKGFDIMIVPPNSLRMFMLGRYKLTKEVVGGRKVKIKIKDMVKRAAEQHAGRMFATNDQSDAYSLLLMGEARANPRLSPRLQTDYRRIALAGCEYIQGPVRGIRG